MIPHAATVLNLASILEQHAIRNPGRAAVIHQDRGYTYAEVEALSNRCANALCAIGVVPGDHVALSCPNLPYFPIAYFGILKTGAVVVPLNVTFTPREIAYHLRDSDAKLLVCFEGTTELPMLDMAQTALPLAPDCAQLVVLPKNPDNAEPFDGAHNLMRLMAAQPATFETYPTRPDDTAVILYTSGTTGQPKGAELTHFNLTLNAIDCFMMQLPLSGRPPGAASVVLITLPLFHSTAQTAQMNSAIYGGNTLVLMPRFEPAAVLDTMRREHVNFWTGVPTMYWTLLQYAESHSVDVKAIAEHLRIGTSGGAPMPVEVMQRFEQTFGIRILEGYGLSETAPVASFNHAELPSKPGTVGQPLFAVQIRCVDEQDEPVPAGERGEVVIRGHNVMKGYYKQPDATAEVMRNGWFHTGDIGIIDGDGYLAIVDRKKDLILRGGYNVYPRELEEVLITHPAIAMAAVIGVPDARLGEEVKAFVVRKPGAELDEATLTAWCKGQFAAYKYPRLIEFREKLPVGATGKILKRELRVEEASAAGTPAPSGD